jgi:hypothetical protein
MQAVGIIALLPALLLVVGTVLGFQALRDIRVAGGALGGVWRAVIAAGLLPAAVILIVCGGGLLMLVEEISPVPGDKEGIWVALGVMAGIWFCFLMLRAMHRHATGWVQPAVENLPRSLLSTSAIVLTITGAAVFLLLMIRARNLEPIRREMGEELTAPLVGSSQQVLFLLDLAVLLAGLICGVLARREPAGKVCAWICGVLFVLALLTTA